MAEPWVHVGEPLLPVMTLDQQAEFQARREERRKEAERSERAEQREMMLFRAGQEWANALGQRFDPLHPLRHIPSAEARAEMYEAQEAAETRAAARRALEEAGLPVSLLRSALPDLPADVPIPTFPLPTEDELADAELARARRNTERARRASLSAKIRRVLGGTR
jgi:hypothetical protein